MTSRGNPQITLRPDPDDWQALRTEAVANHEYANDIVSDLIHTYVAADEATKAALRGRTARNH